VVEVALMFVEFAKLFRLPIALSPASEKLATDCLNAVQPKNINDMSVTDAVLKPDTLWLNAIALVNIDVIEVTDDVLKLDTG